MSKFSRASAVASSSSWVRRWRKQSFDWADWVSDHKHGTSCEFPPSIGAFSRPGAPQPSGDPVLTLFAETREKEKELHDGVRERFGARCNIEFLGFFYWTRCVREC